MKNFRSAVVGTAMALGFSVAQASPINVGGVAWDPDAPLDFSSFSIAVHQFIDSTTGILSGFGFVSTINGTGQSVFCPGCELTFQFGGFTPVTSGALPTTAGQQIGYTGGFVKVFVDSTPEITNPSDPLSLTAANTGDGALWLDFAAHSFLGTTFTGTVQGLGSDISGLTGIGLLDVVGGLAASNFNTNTRTDGADFRFTTSFSTLIPDNNPLNAVGTGNFFSNSVPEPSTVALIGLGMLGFGVGRRAKKA